MTNQVTTSNKEDQLFKSKGLDKSANAGSVAIEQERAIAEAQGKMVIAKRFPRDESEAYSKIMDSCKRLSMAEIASFSYPRGGSKVTGPTIRLAEEMARCWGNIEYGIRELSQRTGFSEMEAWAWDVETNTVSKQGFTVKHLRDKTGGAVTLTDQRDIYEIAANMGARRLRARIMSILPPDLIESAIAQCRETIRTAGANIPLADRSRKMSSAFGEMGIDSKNLSSYLGHSMDNILPDEFVDLTNIYQSIKNGMSKPSDWFGSKSADAHDKLKALTKPDEKPEADQEIVNENPEADKETVSKKTENKKPVDTIMDKPENF